MCDVQNTLLGTETSMHVHGQRQGWRYGTGRPVDKISLYYLALTAPVHIDTLCSVFSLKGLMYLFDF